MNQIRLSTKSSVAEEWSQRWGQFCISKFLVLFEEECFFISFRKALFNWYAFLCASAEKEKQGKHNLHQGSTLNQHLVTTHFQLESCKWNLQITNKLPICWRINDIELINAIRSKRGVLIQRAYSTDGLFQWQIRTIGYYFYRCFFLSACYLQRFSTAWYERWSAWGCSRR